MQPEVIGAVVGGSLVGLIGLIALRRYINGGRNYYSRDLTSKVAIVTGSNCGIGYITAETLLSKGATVIMACRDLKKGEDARKSILKSTKIDDKYLVLAQLDLGDQESIGQFANWFDVKYDQLDLLINNAGVMMPSELMRTKDGLELQVGTNHLGHFLLTHKLIDKLCKTKESRIVTVSSLAHGWGGKIDPETWLAQKSYDKQKQYGISKLANLFFARTLAEKYPEVMSVSLHPGVVKTQLGRHLASPCMQIVLFPLFFIFTFFMKSQWYGAQTSLFCALAPLDQLQNGGYYSDCHLKKVAPTARNTNEDEKLLWNISCEALNIKW